MKTRTLKVSRVLLAVVVFSPVSSEAQTRLQSSVVGNGAINVSSGTIGISGTVGQPLVGHSGNASLKVDSGFWAHKIEVITSVEESPIEAIPNEFSLEQNYPNPFNPATTIEFALPNSSIVRLKLFDLLGRQVLTLVDEEMKAGRYKIVFKAEDLPSGIYFYRIRAGDFVQAKKLTLLK